MTIDSVLSELSYGEKQSNGKPYDYDDDKTQKIKEAKSALLEIIKGVKPKKPDFENYLMEKHCEQYVGTKDNLIDDFNDWIQDLDIDTLISYANRYYKLGCDEYEKAIEELFK